MNRISLDNSFFEGQNNAYLFEGEGPTTLVDTGVAAADPREQLADALAARDLTFAAIDQILLTHWHADHAGLAGEIQAAGGATVRVHAADAPLVEQDSDTRSRMRTRRDDLFEEWGIPPDPRAELTAFLDDGEQISGDAPTVTPFEGGATFTAGDDTLTAIHLPGHTSGLTGFVRETADERDLFSGDALLPEYTPNVGGADIRVEQALEKYLTTLATIHDAGFNRAWPGHRDAIDDPTGRAADIIAHHRERTERVVAALRQIGPADPWTVSAELFGDLSNIHILHGPGEAFAHLDHLVAHDHVRRTAEGYDLVDTDPDLDSLFPAL